MQKIDKSAIDCQLHYVGYLWYSDAERPELIDGLFDVDKLTIQPRFVIEGALYCDAQNISISIKNIDGEYLIHQVNTKDIPKDNIVEHIWFMAKDRNRKVRMWEVWQEEKDKYCENMPTLRPAFWLFKGFK